MKEKDKKKILKIINSFEKLKDEHEKKIKEEEKNYAVVEYWNKQIKRFEEEIRKQKQRLNDI